MDKYRRRYQTDIVIVGWNNADLTYRCIQSVKENTPQEAYQITYVDNGSDRQTADYWIRNKFADLNYVSLPFNHGYVRGTNIGMALSLLTDSEYILLLNNDTEIPADDGFTKEAMWLARLIAPMQEDGTIGAVGAVSNNVFGYQRRDLARYNYSTPISYAPSLIGFCLLLRKEAVLKVGLLDERFEPGNFDDFDYSLRLTKAGYKLAIAESVFIHHKMHASFKELDKTEPFGALLQTNKEKLYAKWGAAELAKVGL